MIFAVTRFTSPFRRPLKPCYNRSACGPSARTNVSACQARSLTLIEMGANTQ